MPATILSRCQTFTFKRITNKGIIEQLNELCQKETINIDSEALRLIASQADGSMRDAESILDQIIAYAGSNISAQDVASLHKCGCCQKRAILTMTCTYGSTQRKMQG